MCVLCMCAECIWHFIYAIYANPYEVGASWPQLFVSVSRYHFAYVCDLIYESMPTATRLPKWLASRTHMHHSKTHTILTNRVDCIQKATPSMICECMCSYVFVLAGILMRVNMSCTVCMFTGKETGKQRTAADTNTWKQAPTNSN